MHFIRTQIIIDDYAANKIMINLTCRRLVSASNSLVMIAVAMLTFNRTAYEGVF